VADQKGALSHAYIPDIYGESRVIDEREAFGEAVHGSYVNAWREAPEQ